MTQTPNENGLAQDQEDGPLYLARLVRGEVHYLRDIRFDNGCDVVVMQHHRDHLEEHGVDVVGDEDGEVMVKDKFTFKLYVGDAPVGTVVAGISTNRDNKDREAEARMRAFSDKEDLRRQKSAREAPKFDKATRDAPADASVSDDEEGLPPRPRPRGRQPQARP